MSIGKEKYTSEKLQPSILAAWEATEQGPLGEKVDCLSHPDTGWHTQVVLAP